MTKPSGKNARIDKGIYAQLAEYSEETGVPVSKCIHEALERWLTTVAPARLKALDRSVRFNENGVGSVSGIVGHPDVTEEDFVAQGIERMKDAGVKK